jgi:hypothetical protein
MEEVSKIIPCRICGGNLWNTFQRVIIRDVKPLYNETLRVHEKSIWVYVCSRCGVELEP